MKVSIPDFAVVVFVGPNVTELTNIARANFQSSEIFVWNEYLTSASINSGCDELPFSRRHKIYDRLRRRELTVICTSFTNFGNFTKQIKLARSFHAAVIAIVLDVDYLCYTKNCHMTNIAGIGVSRENIYFRDNNGEGQADHFEQVYMIRSRIEAHSLQIEKHRLPVDRRNFPGPFDIIGDVHGCFNELQIMLRRLGYSVDPFNTGEKLISARHPEGRVALFVGDIIDRGPQSLDCLRLVMGMCEEGTGLCVVGNHEFRLQRWFEGYPVKLDYGLDVTIDELRQASDEFRKAVREFVHRLVSHYWLANGDLVVAHAGLKKEMHGRCSASVKYFALYGQAVEEVDELGFPIRLDWTRTLDWAREYDCNSEVVFGHTTVMDPKWVNSTICIDTGCVFGGCLTALRWPEKELVSVSALFQYAGPAT